MQHAESLRQRNAHARGDAKALLLALTFTCASCKGERAHEHEHDLSEPISAVSLAHAIGADAALVAPPAVDPPAAAGDLKAEVAKFTTLDACVSEHAHTDPLVGDALEAIGYDTFLRDACRILESMRQTDPHACAPIESSSLRARCESFVAMASGRPDACPFEVPADPSRGRDATCVAVALRDARLCAADTRARRATCEALASRDESRCAAATGPERKGCERTVARWRSTLVDTSNGNVSRATGGASSATKAAGRIELHGVNGTPDPGTTATDIASDLERGVVLAREPLGGVRFRVGSLVALGMVPHAIAPQQATRIGVELVLPKEMPGDARFERAELEIPGEVGLTTALLRTTLKATVLELDPTRGGRLRVTIDGTAPTTSGGRDGTYRVHVEMQTFVRDITGGAPSLPRSAPPSTLR